MSEINESLEISMEISAVMTGFDRKYALINQIYQKLSIALVIIGLAGGTIGVPAMFRCPRLRRPVFLYYKVLLLSDFIYCINWGLLALVDSQLTTETRPYRFKHYFWALYSGILSRLITSTCGHLALYMSLLFIIDRALALLSPRIEKKFSSSFLSKLFVAISFFMSSAGHSWIEIFNREVYSFHSNPNATEAVVIYSWRKFNSSVLPKNLLLTKDFLNISVRCIFSLTLLLMTILALFHAVKMRRMSPRVRSFLPNQILARQERALLLFLVVLVGLSFIQVFPRDFIRLWDLLQPNKLPNISTDGIGNKTLNDAKWELNIFLHRLFIFPMIINLVTFLQPSFIFYINFGLNRSFRHAVMRLILNDICRCGPLKARWNSSNSFIPLKKLTHTGPSPSFSRFQPRNSQYEAIRREYQERLSFSGIGPHSPRGQIRPVDLTARSLSHNATEAQISLFNQRLCLNSKR